MRIPIGNCSGVYKITNTVNGKVYIGCSKDVYARVRGHISALQYHRHSIKALQEDYDKFGIEKFTFDIVELCVPDCIFIKESVYIKRYNAYGRKTGYNIRRSRREPLVPVTGKVDKSVVEIAKQMAHEKNTTVSKIVAGFVKSYAKGWTIKSIQ